MSLHAVALAFGLLAGGVDPTPSGDAPLSETEKSFIDAIAATDRAQIELSKAVATRSAQPAVRKLARRIADEDTANYHDLFAIALAKHYAVAPQLDERHRDALDRVRHARTRKALEHAYLDALMLDQTNAAEMLQRIADDGKDAHLAQYARDTLQLVRKQQHAVHEIAGDQRG